LDRYDLIKALEYLNLAVDASNSNPTAYLKRALVQQQLGNESDAAIDFQMANRLNPFIADLMGYNGKSGTINVLAFEPDSYYSDIDWIGRLEYYLELVTKEETHQDLSFDEIVLAEEVILAYEQQDLSDARNKIDSLLELFPNSYLGHDLKGIYYFESENYEVASALFEKSVEINPSFAIGWYNLGLIAQKEGKAVEAIQHFEKATELQADLSKAYFNKALAFKKIGEREQAIKEYDKILEMDGQNHLEALINRGLTKKMLGDFNGSLADFDKALEDRS
jgi:Tfp pilus assembly protein PilF